MTEIIEEKTELKDTILDIVVKYRERAISFCHELSSSESSGPIPCTDSQVAEFIRKMEKGNKVVKLIISDISWNTYGNCECDELYPVILKACRLPDTDYFYGKFKRYYCEFEFYRTRRQERDGEGEAGPRIVTFVLRLEDRRSL